MDFARLFFFKREKNACIEGKNMLFSIRNVCSTAARSLRPSVCSSTVLAKKAQSHANASTANVEDDLNLISGKLHVSFLLTPANFMGLYRNFWRSIKKVFMPRLLLGRQTGHSAARFFPYCINKRIFFYDPYPCTKFYFLKKHQGREKYVPSRRFI